MCQLWVNYVNGLLFGPIIVYMGYQPNPTLLKILGVAFIGYNVYQIGKKQGWFPQDWTGADFNPGDITGTPHTAEFFDRREFNATSSSPFSKIGLRKSTGFQKIY